MALRRLKDATDYASVSNTFMLRDCASLSNSILECTVQPFITVKKNSFLSLFTETIGWRVYLTGDADIILTTSNLDTGSAFEFGVDYYVYLGAGDDDGNLVISKNATYPTGYAADTSRKIGGFHYGIVRAVSSDGKFIPIDSTGIKFGTNTTIWKNNVFVGIVPNSVWDLKNRPVCSPEGMVKVGNFWVDIYQTSAAEAVSFESGTNGLHIASGKAQSKYGQIPLIGTDGLNQYNFSELANLSGKRLLAQGEWIRAAFGNPEGEAGADNYGWTKTSNSARTRTGVKVNATTGAYDAAAGIKPYAVSAYNICDAVGNVWEWLDEMIAPAGGGWVDIGTGKGDSYGNLYGILAGGNWDGGANAGCRASNLGNVLWTLYPSIGCRFACDAL